MKKLLLLLSLFVSAAQTAMAADYSPEKPVETVSKAMTSVERNVRKAAVKVLTGGGHGSGSVIQYKDLQLVITAKHVADDDLGHIYTIQRNGESRTALLVFQSEEHDVAVLVLGAPFRSSTIRAMPWKPTKKYDTGLDIVYSGYPSSHSLMSFDGRIAGYENVPGAGTQLIVNTYGWFGCSGSVVFNARGEILGVLYGVDIEYYPGIQINENMIWVAPIKNINIKEALAPYCRGSIQNYKACR